MFTQNKKDYVKYDLELELRTIFKAALEPIKKDNNGALLLYALQPHHFYSTRLGGIWRELTDALQRGITLNPFPLLANIGYSAKEIADFIHNDAIPLEYLAKAVLASYQRRTASEILEKANTAIQENSDTTAIVQEAHQKLLNLAVQLAPIKPEAAIYDAWQEHILTPPDNPQWGIATGIGEWDKHIGKLIPKNLYIIAAPPSGSKTALAATIAYNIAKTGKKVRYNIMESNANLLLTRFLARETGIPNRYLMRRTFHEDNIPLVKAGIEAVKACAVTIDERHGLTLADSALGATLQQQTIGLDLLIVDHASLIQIDNTENIAKASENRGYGLVNLAKQLNIPIIALSQMNAEGLRNKAGQGNIRDGLGVVMAADVVLELREEEQEISDFVLRHFKGHVTKSRSGVAGSCLNLAFNADRQTYFDADASLPFNNCVFKQN